jgi:GAF domain-containing protein
METSLPRRLLAFARQLHQAGDFGELLRVTRAEVAASMGYHRAWFFVADREDPEEVRLIDYSGADTALIWSVAPVVKVKGDPMMEEIFAAEGPVIVEDARTDPRTNKDFVAQHQCIVTGPAVEYVKDNALGDSDRFFLSVGVFHHHFVERQETQPIKQGRRHT